MSINISNLLPIIIVFQSLLFSLILFSNKGEKKNSNYYLASFLVLLGVQFIFIIVKDIGVKSNFINSSAFLFGYCYGPILYFYTKSLVYKSFDFQRIQLVHFLPGLFFTSLLILGLPVNEMIGVFMYLSLICYVFVATKDIFNYRKVIRETRSEINQINLLWLQKTMILFTIALLLDIFDRFLGSLDFYRNLPFTYLIIAFLVNWMFYKGFKQPQIFLGITKQDEKIVQDKKNISEAKKPNKADSLDLKLIKDFMNNNEVYLNPQLNLDQLSDYLNISPRRLSYLINTFLNINFISFINSYRVKKAKELIELYEENETIVSILYESGFNSKSVFNEAFKKNAGITPTEYRKNYMTKKYS